MSDPKLPSLPPQPSPLAPKAVQVGAVPVVAAGTPLTVTSLGPLRYTEGADAALDRPAHVRAASGAAFVRTPQGLRLAVVQDDANFLALVDVASGKVHAVPLPSKGGLRLFDEGRGNKKDKLDLESLVELPVEGSKALVAFGSGSSAARMSLAVLRVDRSPAAVELVDARTLYAALAQHPLLAGGAELNLEGAVLLSNGNLRLVQRGNGLGRVNALFDVPWAALWKHLRAPDAVPLPPVRATKLSALGEIDGVPLTLTDAASSRGQLWVLAAAEASPNAVDDGAVVGCALGRLNPDGTFALHRLVDAKGAPFVGKPEGLAFDPAQPDTAYVVVDADNPDQPAELLKVALSGR